VSRRALVSIVVAFSLAVVVAACSLPTDRAPRAIERNRLPAVLEPAQNATTTVVSGGDAKDAQICFANEGEVQCVQRKVSEKTPQVLFATLMEGTTKEEKAEGYSSFLPPATRYLGSSLSNHVLTLNLNDGIRDISNPNDKTAFAQIVYTMVKSIPTVRKVAVVSEGKRLPIPTDSGPVDEAGIFNFASPSPTTTVRKSAKDTTAAPTPSLGN
jgi:hypothetical protein